MHKKNTFYVTTPIYYANAKPHLGSLYSTVLADAAARLNRIRGKEAFMLTGTDEHGQKIAQAAEAQGFSPQQLVDKNVHEFAKVWQMYNIDYAHFIRTTDEQHKRGVIHWIEKLMAQGDIYKGLYTGWYCVPCETYVVEKEGETSPACPTCGRATVELSEETYFFRLSAYADRLLQFYAEHPDFITPPERVHEVISFVKSGLKDLSISRTTVTWGIAFPGDEKHSVYVWADALNNYLTAIGYGDLARAAELAKWWPADLQVLGKDIVRFHAVYWPAFLMAAGLELPKKLLVHGWIKVGEQKMSKSLGNVVDPVSLANTYGVDTIRYYLLRHMAVTQDSPFSVEDLETRSNADLANDLGNLLNRMLTLAQKNNLMTIHAPAILDAPELELRDKLWNMLNDFNKEMEDYYFHRAYAHVWKYIHEVNAYFHLQEPWKLAKSNPARFAAVLSATAHSLHAVALLIWPMMPTKMEELLAALGVKLELGLDYIDRLAIDSWQHTYTLRECPPLFTRFEKKEEPVTTEKQIEQTYIGIEDFAKVQLAIGTVKEVEVVPGSDKLYKLTVDCGEFGQRQILSGVRQNFSPEELRGLQGVFVLNLEPRKMMGLESQGMMLFVKKNDGKLTPVTVVSEVPVGSKLQ